jgi:hypothetical protein
MVFPSPRRCGGIASGFPERERRRRARHVDSRACFSVTFCEVPADCDQKASRTTTASTMPTIADRTIHVYNACHPGMADLDLVASLAVADKHVPSHDGRPGLVARNALRYRPRAPARAHPRAARAAAAKALARAKHAAAKRRDVGRSLGRSDKYASSHEGAQDAEVVVFHTILALGEGWSEC